MNVWLRRLIYAALFLVWLMVMSFPVLAFVLATQGEIQIGERTQRHVRLFLLQESDEEGVGLQWTRAAATENCRQGRIIYFMWQGEGNNTSYCTCYDDSGAVTSTGPGPCPAS